MSASKTFRKQRSHTNNAIIPCARIYNVEVLQPLLIKNNDVGGGKSISSPAGALLVLP